MRISAALFSLMMVFVLNACDSEDCLQCVDCPDFTGEYRSMFTPQEDSCDGTAYSVGTTEVPAIVGGQMDIYLAEQGVETIKMRIIQDEIMAEMDGILCTPEESGGYRLQLTGSDNDFSEVTVHMYFRGDMVNPAEEYLDGGLPDGTVIGPDAYVLSGTLTVDYINNTDLNGSCRVSGKLETFSW